MYKYNEIKFLLIIVFIIYVYLEMDIFFWINSFWEYFVMMFGKIKYLVKVRKDLICEILDFDFVY